MENISIVTSIRLKQFLNKLIVHIPTYNLLHTKKVKKKKYDIMYNNDIYTNCIVVVCSCSSQLVFDAAVKVCIQNILCFIIKVCFSATIIDLSVHNIIIYRFELKKYSDATHTHRSHSFRRRLNSA